MESDHDSEEQYKTIYWAFLLQLINYFETKIGNFLTINTIVGNGIWHRCYFLVNYFKANSGNISKEKWVNEEWEEGDWEIEGERNNLEVDVFHHSWIQFCLESGVLISEWWADKGKHMCSLLHSLVSPSLPFGMALHLYLEDSGVFDESLWWLCTPSSLFLMFISCKEPWEEVKINHASRLSMHRYYDFHLE